ncbi:uncharacterized mitochondrial protein AtMg00860-like [Nicotiana sylvestris]|uniref:uncharacterized mitochondrial protein AtMg00860-like n=1 Tax=Nicotiana sylvestris TaxID=4096 RepID=UPI00388C640E
MEAIQNWLRPTSAAEIRSFLGLAGYYRWFVEGFSSIAALLTRLTQKGALFIWSNECETSFQKLKTALTTAPVLVLPTGSGSYTDGSVIAYASWQLKFHEKNYIVHDL